MTTSPKTLRNRNMTAAKRSLKLIQDAVTEHLVALNDGVVPGDDFLASVLKYEAARTTLRTLDAIGENDVEAGPQEGWLATVEVSRDDLDILVGVLRQSDMAIAIEQADKGSPLGNILAILGAGEPEDQS